MSNKTNKLTQALEDMDMIFETPKYTAPAIIMFLLCNSMQAFFFYKYWLFNPDTSVP
jgi:hypothetical protein